MHVRCSIWSCFLLLLSTVSAKSYSKSKDAVLLSNVRSLTLLADKQTSHRRVSAIPQLTCVGGNAKGLYDVDVMRCRNSGAEYDAEDIQWTCQASLPPEFKLGSTEVVCEGYDNADDPYILKGSCGVEYRLILTELGEEKHSKQFSGRPTTKSDGETKSKEEHGPLNQFFTVIFWGVFIAILCTLFYKLFIEGHDNGGIRLPDAGHRPNFFGGGGGGGNDDNNDPPPPYTPRAPPQPKPKTTPSSSRSSRTSNSGSGPGFWSGAATGGAAGYGAGYYMGSRSNNRDREHLREQEQREYERERDRERARERSRERRHQLDLERERSRQHQSSMFAPSGSSASSSGGLFGGSSGSGSSSAGPSSGRYESTGFGGTRRR